ncbi:MAG: GNAT family N-acetyltransferase [Chitinophagaceae bacterium]|nr:GNAT family N-acetyltransferase [Chitinophagaceae bacterium]
MFTARSVTASDKQKILSLYRKVAIRSGGIARSEEEISEDYISHFMDQSHSTGLELVVDHPHNQNEIVAEIHGYKLAPKVFAHIITELTIAVDPDFHGQGIGKLIFSQFLTHIKDHRPDVLRVELVTQESNEKALGLYKKIGFVIEGRLEKRIRMSGKELDADIPMAWFNQNFDAS